ncbi:ORF6N domain-containing protein [Oceanivirga salmonicida]|uniref:ORF6N domain-containing protein n=2 Tax=Oceanivirga salmonicida TaxID=1769291 RepID=UPI0012E2E5C8|nr:ORF6N domain-containing protein [Oceanivirga salmonicida]
MKIDNNLFDKTVIINEENLATKIYNIRGQKVMLDFELAEIYGYETKRFNEQVKRNKKKFEGEDFMFQLTDDELEKLLRSQNATLKKGTGRGSNIKYKPYCFTEQGIYMLMTVLKGELATKQSRALIRTFKSMKDYLVENQNIIGSKEMLFLSIQNNQNTKDIIKIKESMVTKEDLQKVMENFIDPDTYKHFLIMDGQKTEANIAYNTIYKLAKKTIYVVDNYISLKTLELLRVAKKDVKIIVFSDNNRSRNMLTSSILGDFKNDYPDIDIEFRVTNGKYHDRYIVIDYDDKNESIYHCGTSSKDAGSKITTISRVDDTKLYHQMFNELMSNKKLEI